MTEGQVIQRVAAILAADAVGYSRLMADDEPATIAALDAARAIFRGRVEANQGRVVDTAGDSVLAVFETTSGAVRGAVAIQEQLAEVNDALPEDRRMLFRIGVHLGDIHEKADGTIYGDGINVAARLQSLADAGGVVVSGSVRESVRGRLGVGFGFFGEQDVKNIPEPVQAYRVVPEGEARPAARLRARRRLALIAAATAVVAAGVVGVVVWWVVREPERAPEIAQETATREEDDATLALPTGPSIAVLPFANITQDPNQDYFSDGITTDLITDLSYLRGLLVIAQNSTFQFKGKAVDVRDVGRTLGVRHVLEGGVQREGERVRVNVRLIDAISGAEVWAQRYDGALGDIFAVQDEIRRKIVTELDVQLAEGEGARAWRETAVSPEAYDYFLRAREARLRFTKEGVALAKQLSERALELDPDFAMAMVVLGRAHRTDAYSGWTSSVEESYKKALYWINRAIAKSPNLGEAYNTLGEIYFEYNTDPGRAIGYLRKAVELGPNSARNNIILAAGLARYGEAEEGIGYARKAIRLNPNPPAFYFHNLAFTYQLAGQTDEAIEAYKQSIARSPDFIWTHIYLSIAYGQANKLEEARRHAKEVLRINPNFVAAEHSAVTGLSDSALAKEFLSLLRQAGLK